MKWQRLSSRTTGFVAALFVACCWAPPTPAQTAQTANWIGGSLFKR